MNPRTTQNRQRQGIILLVVLGTLTFFSILVVTYLVFSSESKKSSFAIAKRNTRAPDVEWMLNEALMTLVRGTDDPNNPFYGEDLLADYYGRDGFLHRVHHMQDAGSAAMRGPKFVGGGFVRFPISQNGTARNTTAPKVDDLYSARYITFIDGPLVNRTLRVIRSKYRSPSGPEQEHDDVFIELPADVLRDTTPTNVNSLFYVDPSDLTTGGYRFRVNGVPGNSPGVGFDGSNLGDTVDSTPSGGLVQPADPFQPIGAANPPVGITGLPVSLQPNHLGNIVDKSVVRGDFDEGYDAADHHNWFLSHRRRDGSVIPSFHRPAVINYILNQTNWSSSPTDLQLRNTLVSIARATFRPLPIAENQLGIGIAGINEQFTGGSSEFALRTPLRLSAGPQGVSRLDQLARALTEGEWDVDNDADGVADSVWIDLGLPTFTSAEGKLIRPLIAPMVEDLSGKLNLNAHGNLQLDIATAGITSSQASWAGTVGDQTTNPNPANERFVFRGLGWGPAEITIPAVSSAGISTNTTIRAELRRILNDRYRYADLLRESPNGPGPNDLGYVPGRRDRDTLDVLRFGYRRREHRSVFGFGYSTDPFGRGGLAIGRNGSILAAGSGVIVSADDPGTSPLIEPTINEAENDPYESDPSGALGGDAPFTLAEFEAILRSNEFDTDMLPTNISERLRRMFAADPDFATEFTRSITTVSRSDDSPMSIGQGRSSYESLVTLILDIAGSSPTNQAEWAIWRTRLQQLLAPELRLGRKLDVNRPFGNLVDDNGNGTIDEPGEVAVETRAFISGGPGSGAVPTNFASVGPDYEFDEPNTAAGAIPVTGRQLLARHLYVLMMALCRDFEVPSNTFEFPTPATDPSPGYDPARYKARRIAQWAVNVVDYRDPDSIMTRFVFDPFPFTDGWQPPTDTFAAPADPYFVVWGVEQPPLVFSESLAFHDVRLRDTDRDDQAQSTKADGDIDSDQVRIPQGSLFLELYCPHPPILGALPNEQATLPGTAQELFNSTPATGASTMNLAATAANVPNGAPVWRIAISQRHDAGADPTRDPEYQRLDSAPPTDERPGLPSFEPSTPDELGPGTPLPYDRFILFRNFGQADSSPDNSYNQINNLITNNGIVDMSAEQVFFAPTFTGDAETNAVRTLDPGQFLVLAPRLRTYLGSQSFGGAVPGLPSGQRFDVDFTPGAQDFVHVRNDGARLTPMPGPVAAYRNPLPLVIAAPRPGAAAWPAVPGGVNTLNNVIGLNVSEPLPRSVTGYYPQPRFRYNGTEDIDGDGSIDFPLFDAYVDFETGGPTALDTPLDVSTGRIPPADPANPVEPYLGTVPRYCSAFLQRLADPTLPYNAVTNPYRTIDWISIDLNVFTGEDRPSNISNDNGYVRRSRQRNGFIKDGANTVQANALYSYETGFDASAATILATTGDDFFAFSPVPAAAHVHTSLSFLNTAHPQANPGFVGFDASYGSLGSPASDNVIGNDRNLPIRPYAMHPWLNRPFATPFELMMVPASSQGRLFEEFSFDVAAGLDPEIYPVSGASMDPEVFHAPFRHLLNFFHSSRSGGDAAEFVKLFDFVHTLPPYRGEVDYISPDRLSSSDTAEEAILAEQRSLMLPPFNFVYENGREATVNLNAIAEFPVWAGLMQGHLNEGEFSSVNGSATATQLAFNNFLQSRRGYTTTGVTNRVTSSSGPPYYYLGDHLDPEFPTEFGGVYKHATKAPFEIEVGGTTAPNTEQLRRRPVNGGLHRGAGPISTMDPPGGASPTDTPLFVRSVTQAPVPNAASGPLPAVGPDGFTGLNHDRYRNPFMKYQTLMRMPNLASNNSQVFVVRMTLGFFEVDADTLSLGDEYNANIGSHQRYHALFVIDRSIPVAYEPGKDHNARNVVIFESYGK